MFSDDRNSQMEKSGNNRRIAEDFGFSAKGNFQDEYFPQSMFGRSFSAIKKEPQQQKWYI